MPHTLQRRRFLKLISLGSTFPWVYSLPAMASSPGIVTKAIPSSGEHLPVIGMGTWRTFNVGADPTFRDARTRVLERFFQHGGALVDCSPMYGSSSTTLGYALQKLNYPKSLFSAEKVWTSDKGESRHQIKQQANDWGVAEFDLMQIHNLLNWEDHLPTLLEMKASGNIRYVGITTSHGRRHSELEQIMQKHDLDFIQLTYNLSHRDAEQRLLPLAQERGIAVIANRPYDGGTLIKSLKRENTLPDWATRECGCQTWADFLLKAIVAHPAITCAIPATTQVNHMQENMQAGQGTLPDKRQREQMLRYVASL